MSRRSITHSTKDKNKTNIIGEISRGPIFLVITLRIGDNAKSAILARETESIYTNRFCEFKILAIINQLIITSNTITVINNLMIDLHNNNVGIKKISIYNSTSLCFITPTLSQDI